MIDKTIRCNYCKKEMNTLRAEPSNISFLSGDWLGIAVRLGGEDADHTDRFDFCNLECLSNWVIDYSWLALGDRSPWKNK